jgi:hypothetical protein
VGVLLPPSTLTLRANLLQGIFPGNVNKYFCWTLMAYEVAWGIASFFASLFQCAPIQSYWLIQSPVRDCLNVGALYYSTSGLNIFTDCMYKDQHPEEVPALIFGHSSPHLPVASQRPRISSDICSPTHHSDHHVLSRRDNMHCWAISCVVHIHLHPLLGLLM